MDFNNQLTTASLTSSDAFLPKAAADFTAQLFEVRALGVEVESPTADVNSSNTNKAAVRLFLPRKLASR